MMAGAQAQTVTETVVHSFTGTTDSVSPAAGVIQAGDGQMYGTTAGNFFTDFGSVYGVSLDGTFRNVYQFGGITDSATPLSPVVQGADGNLYGSTYGNLLLGTPGTVFSVAPAAGTLTTLYNFTGATDGANPETGLLPLSNGTFYGSTSFGGANYGTLFSIGAASPLSTLVTFNKFNGTAVLYPPVEGLDGNFYGVTSQGGATNLGTFYKLTPTGTLTTLYTFMGTGDGGSPYAIVEGADGNFYGATGSNGNLTGSDKNGTIFKITSAGVLTTLYSLNGTTDGSGPSNLFLGGDGYLYGATLTGGANSGGTVFRISLSGTFTLLYSLGAGADVSWPQAGVLEASDGTLWGTGALGGTAASGGVFKLTLSPAPAAPLTLSASKSVIALGDPVTLTWSSLNSFSNTMQHCNASITPAPLSAAGWSGAQTGTYNATTKVWSGSATITPVYQGTYTYGITCGGVESATTSVTVGQAAALTISSQSFPTAYLTVPYSTTVGVSGGVAPFIYSVSVGSLPAGLTLNTSTGVISGTPTQTGVTNFTIKVVDSNSSGAATATASLGITVLNKLVLSTTILPDARIGSAYSQQLVATGGTPPYTFSLLTGSTLPAGLTLSSTGLLSGTPTATATDTFSLLIKDSGGQSITPSLTLTVDPLISTSGVLTLTPSTINVGGTTNMSLTITSPSGSPTMMGTVQFEANGLPLGAPVAVNSGVAALTTPAMNNSGNITITAFYSGDSNFLALGYPSQTLVVNSVAQPSIVITPSVVNMTSGGDAQVTVNLLGFSSSSVSLSCGTLPTYMQCAFSPVANNASTLTVHTFTYTAANASSPILFAGVFPGILLLGFATRKRKLSRKVLGGLSLLVFLALGLAITGCGDHTTINKTGTGVSTITVTATAGSQTASTSFTLSVH